MDKMAAKEEAWEIDSAQECKYCPLSGSYCRTKCVVYVKSIIIKETKPGQYEVKPGYCNAHCLIG